MPMCESPFTVRPIYSTVPLTVVLHLIENEHFNARIDEYKKRTNGTPAAKTWTVPGIRSNSTNNIPNRLTGPGSVKFPRSLDASEIHRCQFGHGLDSERLVASRAGRAKVSYGRLGFAAKAVRNYLQEQADNDTPVKDKDGSYMQLADGYTVDYSRYE